MVISRCSVSFSIIVCIHFSKWRINVFLKLKKVASTPLTFWLWRLTLPPGKVVPPIFFMKMTAKDVEEITYMPLVTFFSVLERPGGKTVKGLQQPPLVRRGLRYVLLYTPSLLPYSFTKIFTHNKNHNKTILFHQNPFTHCPVENESLNIPKPLFHRVSGFINILVILS